MSSHTSIALLAMFRARHKERRILLSECEMFEAERQAVVVLVLARVSRSCSHACDFFVCAGLCRVAHRHHLYCWPRKSVPGGPSLSFGAGSCQARVDTPELVFEGSVQREALMAQRFFESRKMFVKAALAVRVNAASRHVPRGTSARVTSKGVLTIFTLQGVDEPRPYNGSSSVPSLWWCCCGLGLPLCLDKLCVRVDRGWQEAKTLARVVAAAGQKLAVACLC